MWFLNYTQQEAQRETKVLQKTIKKNIIKKTQYLNQHRNKTKSDQAFKSNTDQEGMSFQKERLRRRE